MTNPDYTNLPVVAAKYNIENDITFPIILSSTTHSSLYIIDVRDLRFCAPATSAHTLYPGPPIKLRLTSLSR